MVPDSRRQTVAPEVRLQRQLLSANAVHTKGNKQGRRRCWWMQVRVQKMCGEGAVLMSKRGEVLGGAYLRQE